MKRLLIGLVLFVMSWSASASNLDSKYQLDFFNDISGFGGTFVFLMNDQGEVKILDEKSDYYIQAFDVNPFFMDLDFEIEWGSDEERHYFSFTLAEVDKAPVITRSCALYVDGPNGFHDFGVPSFSLKKWNEDTKSFEDVSVSQSEKALLQCQKELTKKYLSH